MDAYTRVDNAEMTISNRLNEAMQEGDGRERVSQSELSRRSGVPQPTIARILTGVGRKGPETATLIALANALGVEFMWLQQGNEPKYPGGATSAQPAPLAAVPERAPVFKRHWLSEDEADHLANYRSITKQGRHRIRLLTAEMKRERVNLDRDDSAADDEF